MDAFDFDNVKAEKAKAMLRYNRLRTMAKLFRLVEICSALVFLSWISARLPFAVRISGVFFRKLIAVIVSPLFIFLVSNAIVITLLVKSGQFDGQNPAANNAETDLYEEFIENSEIGMRCEPENCPTVPEPEEIVYQDKQIISEVNTITPKSNVVAIVADTVSDVKTFRRTQSENLKRANSEKPCRKLRRSDTEKCRKVVDSGDVPAETLHLVDKLSNEEFQRHIEEFIAKCRGPLVRAHDASKRAQLVPKELSKLCSSIAPTIVKTISRCPKNDPRKHSKGQTRKPPPLAAGSVQGNPATNSVGEGLPNLTNAHARANAQCPSNLTLACL